MDLTQEQKNKLMVCAQAFFRDGQGDKDYPFKDVSDQYDEFLKMTELDASFWRFLDSVYGSNK